MDGNDQAREAARRRAVQVRERTFSRRRKVLAAAIGLSAALSGAFAELAASSTHAKKAVRLVPAAPARSVSLPAPRAVAPSATPPGAAASAPQAAPAPPPAPAPPQQPPVVTSAPPVATSGGT